MRYLMLIGAIGFTGVMAVGYFFPSLLNYVYPVGILLISLVTGLAIREVRIAIRVRQTNRE